MNPETSLEALRAENQRLTALTQEMTLLTQELSRRIQDLEAIRRELEHTVGLYQRHLFGSRSEKVSAEELAERIAQHAQEAREQMAGEKRPGDPPPQAEEEAPDPADPGPTDKADKPEVPGGPAQKKDKRKARPHGRNGFPEHLPRRRIDHPVDPALCFCQTCAGNPPLTLIGQDEREKLCKLPVQYEVQVHVYPKYGCQKCHEGIVMAEGPDHGLKADVSVVADVVVQKYADHKPLYRQQQTFQRQGIPITRQTLCDWTGWCSDQVEPVVKAMADYIRAQRLIQSDETSVRMQMADGQMLTARLWGYCIPWKEVVFDFRTDKSHLGPQEFLLGTGALYLQADGGSSYEPVLRCLELSHIACMAHIRRKFFEARADAPVAVDLVLAAMQRLYRIERQAKEENWSLEKRLEARQREAKPIFTDLGLLIEELSRQVLPKSPLGRAVSYAQNQWLAMARYLEVPEAEIDNNSMEHALRDVVMGRKNWLHVGQEAGGERAANLFSLMVSCKRLGVDPYAYLHDILRRLPSHLQKDIWQLTPRGWKETFGANIPPQASAVPDG